MMQAIKENWWGNTSTGGEPKPPPNEITPDTYVNIWYDTSGSMEQVQPQLEAMVATGGPLYNKLRPYYNSDAEYHEKTNFFPWGDETTLLALSDRLHPNEKTINLVFQNEAGGVYYDNIQSDWTINTPRFAKFESDMSALRSRLSGYDQSRYHGIVMQIQSKTGTPEFINEQKQFGELLQAVHTGTGQYTGYYSLTDKPYITTKFNVDADGDSVYFADKVVETLNELGFNIPT